MRWIIRTVKKAVIGFFQDECFLHASALTYYTLLSLVPLLAIAFGIAKGFGFDHLLQSEIMEKFQNQEQIVEKGIEFAHSLLKHVKGGLIAAIGGIFLFGTILSLMTQIENAFNQIWHIHTGRSILRKCTDYLAVVILAPIVFVLSSSVSVFILTQIEYWVHTTFYLEPLTPLLYWLVKLSPFFLSWLLFLFLYSVIPNTRVPFGYALSAAILAGTLFQLTQWAYIKFQIGVSSYGAIYGSFAALPLFLIWVQTSWLLVLFGAEIASQAEEERAVAKHSGNRMQIPQREVAHWIAQQCIEAFRHEKGATVLMPLCRKLGISHRRGVAITDRLVKGGILSRVSSDKYNETFQPAKPVASLPSPMIYQSLDLWGAEPIRVSTSAFE